jgi:methylated-DNA-[protein]-cysteine S-methyltransferase
MSVKPAVCRELEEDLVATAAGEAGPGAARQVEDHVRVCGPCRAALGRYREVDTLARDLRAGAGDAGLDGARGELERRLAELRRRAVAYRVFPSPLGSILIARSEEGVALVRYVTDEADGVALLRRMPEVEVIEDGAELEPLHQQLLEYLTGQRTRLPWSLDFRLARTGFSRTVLSATAALPYGAVTSYGRIAREIGQPSAVRAVAQALRWNPLPIVVPCHRVIGSTGSLTGYAGNRVSLKQRLLALEGVPTTTARRDVRVVRDTMYVLGEGEAEYCLPTCGSIASVPLARLTLFAGRERAEAAGFAPCTTCRPDLHPLLR